MSGGARVAFPTVLLGLGRFGNDVVARVLQSLPAEDRALVRDVRCGAREVASQLSPVLDELLRVGRQSGDRVDPRLDLFVFAAALQLDDSGLLDACDGIATLLRQGYAAIFPPDRPPEQRTAALQLVVQVPPLSQPAAQVALQRLSAVEKWAGSSPAFPVLSRIWLIGQQTTAGTLMAEDVVASAAAFAVSAFACGARGEDLVRHRVAHPAPGEGRVCMASVASAELPEARIREYAIARAAYDALSALASRVEEVPPDPALALATVSALHHEEWTQPFTEGEAPNKARKIASELSRTPGAASAPIQVGAFDSAEDLRARYRSLVEPVSAPSSATPTDALRIDELQRLLDTAEAGAASAIEQGVQQLFSAVLGQATGLRQLPAVEAGLRRVSTALEEQRSWRISREWGDGAGGPQNDEGLAELNAALDRLPARRTVLATAAAVGVGVLLLASAITLSALNPSSAAAPGHAPSRVQVAPSAAPPSLGFDWGEAAPWLVGLAAGLAAAYGWAVFSGRRSRAAVRAALARRSEALANLAAGGGTGAAKREVDRHLALRARRVLRAGQCAVDGALARLQAIRRTLHQERDYWRQELVRLGAAPGPEAASDDLGGLFNLTSPMHKLMLPSPVLARWVARHRELQESKIWADRLLDGCWPAGGLGEDAPCADRERVRELCLAQVRPLASGSIFDEQETCAAAAEALKELVSRVPSVLAPPCQPRDAHGDPAQGHRAGEGFVIAPASGRDALESALKELAMRLPIQWMQAPTPHVLFVRTWEGLTVEDIYRGAHVGRRRA